jgi:tRNA (cytidine/uridine-2'-O-)-methyltransferase
MTEPIPVDLIPKPSFNVVLFQPEIPQNTGNIGRSCVALEAKLWIVRPTGFRLDAKQLQRAGLDYWQHLHWESVDSWPDLEPRIPRDRVWFFTKFASRSYSDVVYRGGDWLVFGSESSGLPESIRETYSDRCVRLPMTGPVRSLNLSVAVGIGLFEAHRQTSMGLKVEKTTEG